MRRFFIVAVLVLQAGFAFGQTSDRITLMTYNVENFFDAVDDPRYPNDRETLNDPAWVDAKAAAIARVINRFDGGVGPDVLVLTEVESKAALDAIKTALTGSADYLSEVFFDADPTRPDPKPDFRGIDVAILSKLPFTDGYTGTSHQIDLSTESACDEDDGTSGSTRDAIAASFALPDGNTLTVFGVHFPSGRNPRVCREIAARTVRDLADALPSDHVAVVMGDYNFNCRDAEQTALSQVFSDWDLPSQLDNSCTGNGSHWFSREGTWSYLDIIAARPGTGDWHVDMPSFRLVLNDFEQLFFDKKAQMLRPKKFRLNTANPENSGTSDHWPVAVDLKQ